MIKIIKSEKCYNKDMSVLFVDSFYEYLASFCKNKDKLYKCFKGCFSYDKFYLVISDDEKIIGMGSCGDGKSTIRLNKIKFYLNLGFPLGNRMYKYLKVIFEDRDYSFEMDDKCGMIEFVAIKESYRNKKIGFTLVNHIMYDNEYLRYLTKVGDNNISYRKILDNIGFEVFDEESATIKEKEEIGINNYLYMICENYKLK